MERISVQRIRRMAVLVCVVALAVMSAPGQQVQIPPAVPGTNSGPNPGTNQAPAQMLPPQQLDNLVAPIALYPDPLLSQVLAASTYPVELVEAQQWSLANQNLSGQQLMDAARQQNWDPSVQALVAMPNVLSMLTQDIRWTTDLGNAFLSCSAGRRHERSATHAAARAGQWSAEIKSAGERDHAGSGQPAGDRN